MVNKKKNLEQKIFFLFVSCFLFQSLLCHNNLQNRYSQPIIHIHNTVVTSGSSFISAFKYFSLMIVAWESGVRFVGYSHYGFIHKVVKPVLNWFLGQTKNSVEQCINYFSLQNTMMATLFVECVLEPLKKRFFQDDIRITVEQEREKRNVVSVAVQDSSETDKGCNTMMHQDDVKDFDQNKFNTHEKLNSIQNVGYIGNTQFKDLDEELRNFSIICNDGKQNNSQIDNESLLYVSNQKKIPSVWLNSKKASNNSFLNLLEDAPISIKLGDSTLPEAIFKILNLPNTNDAKEKLELLADDFLKNEYDNGNERIKLVIESFYSQDIFKKFGQLKESLKRGIRTSFFLFAQSLTELPLSQIKTTGHLVFLGSKNYHNKSVYILNVMKQLYCLFEKNPQSCLEMIGFCKSPVLKKNACL